MTVPEIRIYIETDHHGPSVQDISYGYVMETMYRGSIVTREGFGKLKQTSENRAALMAICEAVSRITKPSCIRVITGCRYICGSVTNGWTDQWRKNGWKNAKGELVKNADLWERLYKYLSCHLFSVKEQKTNTYSRWMLGRIEKGEGNEIMGN